jgi:predicted transcriptional regulator
MSGSQVALRAVKANDFKLANKGTETRFIFPEPFISYNNTKYKTELKEWIDKRKRNHFENVVNSRGVF